MNVFAITRGHVADRTLFWTTGISSLQEMTRPRKVKTRSVGYRVSRRGVKKHENLLRCPRFGSGFELSMCVRGICVWRELGPLCCRLIAPPGGGEDVGCSAPLAR